MKALTDDVHSKGLNISLYSSPGSRACQQRFEGSYRARRARSRLRVLAVSVRLGKRLQADDFTIDLLGNRKVLAVNQDPMGKAAARVTSDTWTQV